MNTEQWSLAVAALSFLVAGVALYFARHQAQSARDQLKFAERVQREATEPYVIVDIVPREPWSPVFVVAIENIGPTVARDVRINVTPNIESSLDDDATQDLQRALSRRIPMLPPGRRLEYLFDTGGRWETDLPMIYEFLVHANGPSGPVEAMQYVVDLHVFGPVILAERPTKKIEQELSKLRSLVKGLGDNYAAANDGSIRATNQRRREAAAERYRQLQARLPDLNHGTD
jgi:hypothetical protein